MDSEIKKEFDLVRSEFKAEFIRLDAKLDRVLFGIVGGLLAYALGIGGAIVAIALK